MKKKIAAVVRKLSQLADDSPDIPALGIAALAMLWCVSLWAARAWFTGNEKHFYLV